MEDSRRKGVSTVSCCLESDCDEGTDMTVTAGFDSLEVTVTLVRVPLGHSSGQKAGLTSLINCFCVSLL